MRRVRDGRRLRFASGACVARGVSLAEVQKEPARVPQESLALLRVAAIHSQKRLLVEYEELDAYVKQQSEPMLRLLCTYSVIQTLNEWQSKATCSVGVWLARLLVFHRKFCELLPKCTNVCN